ncbi:Uncharacterized conserved protein YgbK, DUF1537 family [Gilliamella bombicola]|uniref:Uncharacterized conserved protein YgbK, DUF1537 family n=1 Tax=Gilliamella bombicola TaxID=1798182 RepID=A0A1C4DQY6_9GAMM|nr:four-carbon acid sugar kinase family protein [Gilliamella bombicola]SCC33635.1 Uncharacterized conserved protein YgbK, DUF1537 family [Gilliamella bombicola]
MTTQYLIIADDYTGANDTGIQMKKRGIAVDVLLTPTSHSNSIVLDTESRNLCADEAYLKVKKMTSEVYSLGKFDIVYKKVDSTLRGNIAQEIKAVADIFHPDIIVFAPAFPKLNRITKNGKQYLNGQLLMNTELTKDPLSPIITDDLTVILQQAFKEQVYYHPISELEGNTFSIKDGYLHIVDIAADKHIAKLSEILLNLNKRILYVGSAGLAEGIFNSLYPTDPVLGVVASISQVSIDQINYAESEGINIVKIEPADIFDSKTYDNYIERISFLLSQKNDVIITTCKSKKDYEKTLSVSKNNGFSSYDTANKVKACLAYIVDSVLKKSNITGLFLTGGDTAVNIVSKINAAGCSIKQEISPGIVMSNLIHEEYGDIKVITKAGAFGNEKDLVISINKLKEK